MDTEVAPIAVENLPALHAVHSVVEDASEYVPARQVEQLVDDALEYVPARQGRHVDTEVAPIASE